MTKKFNYVNKTWEAGKELKNRKGETVGVFFNWPPTSLDKEVEPVISPLIKEWKDEQKPFDNELSQAEAERLAILAEEAAEVIHVVGKILRHGYSSEWQKVGKPNRKQLEREVGDLLNIISVMWWENDINQGQTLQNMQDKGARWMEYTHHQGL